MGTDCRDMLLVKDCVDLIDRGKKRQDIFFFFSLFVEELGQLRDEHF